MKHLKIKGALLPVLAAFSLLFTDLPAAQAQTQGQMNETAGRRADRADAVMNTAYKKLVTVLDTPQKAQLKKAQTAWLAFRDADAALLSSQDLGGSIYPMVYANNRQEITEQRTRELKKTRCLLSSEGDR